MKFSSDELKTTFETPDRPTAREWLEYESAVDFRSGTKGWEMYARLWSGVCTGVVRTWQSEIISKPALDILDQELDYKAIQVIKWAGMQLFSWLLDLREIPKN